MTSSSSSSGADRWKRGLKRLSGVGQPPQVPTTAEPPMDGPPDRAAALLRAARAHAADSVATADSSTAEKALGEYREAVAASDFDPSLLVELAQVLTTQSSPAAAEAVLALAVASGAQQVEAVDLYLDLVVELELPPKRVSWALRQLRAVIEHAPEQHRAALDYAITHRQDEVLDLIGQQPDAMNRAIVRINDAYRAETLDADTITSIGDELGLSPTDARQAHLAVALARGNRATSASLLAALEPAEIPADSLRRAIRRAHYTGRKKQLRSYLTEYLRARPDDAWALDLYARSVPQAPTNYELGKSGFPLPSAQRSAEYVPEPDRIFYLLHNSLPYNSAGYATRTHGLLKELNLAGWDVDGVTRLGYPYDMPGNDELPDVPPHEEIDGVDYLRLLTGRQIEKKNPLYSYVQRYSTELIKAARRDRPAIIHAASNHWNGLTGVHVARKLGLPSIYEIRGLWEVTRGSRNPEWAQSNMYKYIARMEADAAKGATKVFTITGALRDEMVARGVDEGKITVLPNGVDTERFTPIPRDEQLARELGVEGKTVIGYVGSILDYEGLGLLIDAAAALSTQRDDFHVLIVGDGAELEIFTQRVRELGLEQVITFTGRVPHEQVEKYYSLVDITPFPRLPLPVCEMVSPLKPFEAMAMGKAVVASDVAALAEIVTPGENGLLHAKGDAASLRAELQRLLDDPELTRSLGEKARAWVVRNRDWKTISTIVAETYAELTGSSVSR